MRDWNITDDIKGDAGKAIAKIVCDVLADWDVDLSKVEWRLRVSFPEDTVFPWEREEEDDG